MRIFVLLGAALCVVHVASGATFQVTTPLDAGPGSLREAILSANAAPGNDDIVFAIVGPGPYSILPLTPLPAISDAVTIDASTQPGFAGTPIVELTGTAAGVGANGLHITAGRSTVRGLIINRFSNAGILVESNGNNIVMGNFIGTDRFGTTAAGNGMGVHLRSGTNTIGLAGGGNVISGNNGRGIFLQTSSFNVIEGNLLGVDVTANNRLGNFGDAIHLANGSVNNQIGGAAAGAGNVIANSSGFGIFLYQSTGNVMEGNTIGTDGQGRTAMPNTLCGITCAQSGMNRIGGLEPGSRNLISGNGVHGIEINGANSAANVVQGNWIGTDANGTGAIPNGSAGIFISAGPFNVIGSSDASGGNVISGNAGSGVQILFALSNALVANLIGVTHDGSGALGNMMGIELSHSSYNTIGFADPDSRNTVSGNRFYGISITGASTGNRIEGNHVGTDVTGMLSTPNFGDGVYVEGASNFVGGPLPEQRNLISGNLRSGIRIQGSAATGNVVQGNFIGTDASGTRAIGNLRDGITIEAPANTIGGTGTDPIDGNVISGNVEAGIYVGGNGAIRNVIQGNLIGVDERAQKAIPNQKDGIHLATGGNETTLGGSENAAGNTISGNLNEAIEIRSSTNVVQGNFIGVDITGTIRLPNRNDGVWVRGSANIIGGTEIGAGNRIAFAEAGNGVRISSSGIGNSVVGNSIWGNSYLGINLDSSETVQDPVTANDVADADTGPNRLQNFPVLTNVVYAGATLTVQGFIESTANRSLNVDFYANASFDTSGHGEGEQYLGRTTVITDVAGYRAFSFSIPNLVSNQYVTATATDVSTGDTSEFSAGSGGLRITNITPNGDVTFTTYAGRNHRLEYATDLTSSPNWQPVSGAANVLGTGGAMTINDPPTGAAHLYRLVLLP